MSSSQVKMVGWSGLAYAIMIVVYMVLGVVFAASAIGTAVDTGQAPTTMSTPMATQIVGLITSLVFIWMIYSVASFLTKVRNVSSVMPIALVIILLVVLEIIASFIGVSATSFSFEGVGIMAIVLLIVTIVKGILLIIFGVKALQGGSGAWKAFGILTIIAGALTAVVILFWLAPFVWIAAGIVLMVAAFGSAKESPVTA